MLAWSATEAVLRNVLRSSSESTAPLGTGSLLRLAASEGLVGEEDLRRLNQILLLRDAVAHGFQMTEGNLAVQARDATEALSRVSHALIRELAEPA
jgi:hypothetical protein